MDTDLIVVRDRAKFVNIVEVLTDAQLDEYYKVRDDLHHEALDRFYRARKVYFNVKTNTLVMED